MMTEPAPQPERPAATDRSCLKWGAIGCAIVALLGALGGATIVFVAFGAMKRSDAYSGAVERARAHPEVVAVLGEPIETGFFVSGSVKISGPSGQASLSIPLEGPRGEGRLYVEAVKRAGRWEYELLELAPEGGAPRIDVLAGADGDEATFVSETAPAEAEASPPASGSGEPAIDEIVFSIDEEGREISDRFPSGVRLVLAGVHFANIGPEDEIVHRWYHDGEKAAEEFTAGADLARGAALPPEGWLTLRINNPAGLDAGQYRLDVWLNGSRAASGTFVVE